jgi:hypothetical protein
MKKLYEIELTPAHLLCEEIEDTFYEIFPNSVCVAKFETNLGPAVSVGITLGKDKSEYPNNIINNDPLFTHFFIHNGVGRDGSLSDKLSVESSTANIGRLKPDSPYMAQSSLRYFRKFSGSPEKIIIGFEKMFLKIHSLIEENIDNFLPGLPYDIEDKL